MLRQKAGMVNPTFIYTFNELIGNCFWMVRGDGVRSGGSRREPAVDGPYPNPSISLGSSLPTTDRRCETVTVSISSPWSWRINSMGSEVNQKGTHQKGTQQAKAGWARSECCLTMSPMVSPFFNKRSSFRVKSSASSNSCRSYSCSGRARISSKVSSMRFNRPLSSRTFRLSTKCSTMQNTPSNPKSMRRSTCMIHLVRSEITSNSAVVASVIL